MAEYRCDLNSLGQATSMNAWSRYRGAKTVLRANVAAVYSVRILSINVLFSKSPACNLYVLLIFRQYFEKVAYSTIITKYSRCSTAD